MCWSYHSSGSPGSFICHLSLTSLLQASFVISPHLPGLSQSWPMKLRHLSKEIICLSSKFIKGRMTRVAVFSLRYEGIPIGTNRVCFKIMSRNHRERENSTSREVFVLITFPCIIKMSFPWFLYRAPQGKKRQNAATRWLWAQRTSIVPGPVPCVFISCLARLRNLFIYLNRLILCILSATQPQLWLQ